VREQTHGTRDPRQIVERRKCRAERRALESQAIHAAVEFEPDLEGRALASLAQQIDLFRRVHHELEARGRRRVELPAIEDALEQHGAFLNARIAQCDAFIDTRDREGIRRIERARHRHEPMSVGIRLDDGHDSGARRPTANLL